MAYPERCLILWSCHQLRHLDLLLLCCWVRSLEQLVSGVGHVVWRMALMGRAAELLDGSAGQGFRAAEGSLRSAAAAGAEPSVLASSSIGFPELVCFCWRTVCGRRSMSFCWSAGWGRQSKFSFPEMVCPAEQWMWFPPGYRVQCWGLLSVCEWNQSLQILESKLKNHQDNPFSL